MNVIAYDLYLNKAVTKKLKEENLGLGISKYILMIILIRTVRCPQEAHRKYVDIVVKEFQKKMCYNELS